MHGGCLRCGHTSPRWLERLRRDPGSDFLQRWVVARAAHTLAQGCSTGCLWEHGGSAGTLHIAQAGQTFYRAQSCLELIKSFFLKKKCHLMFNSEGCRVPRSHPVSAGGTSGLTGFRIRQVSANTMEASVSSGAHTVLGCVPWYLYPLGCVLLTANP